jgi:hypothetical protein
MDYTNSVIEKLRKGGIAMIVLDKKMIVGIFACCFVACVEADSDFKENGDVHGNYWGFRVNKQGDGPIEVETERSTYNKDGVVQSERESGYLEFDRSGRAYIRKADGTAGAVAPNQPFQPIPVAKIDAEERPETSRMCPGRHFNRERLNVNRDKQSLVQEIKQELLQVSELIEREAVHPNNEVDRHEIYHFLKKKLKKVKRMAKFLLKSEEFRQEKRKKWFDFI